MTRSQLTPQAVGSRSAFCAWFIQHPVGTTLLTLAVVMLGLIAFARLPVAMVPETDIPTIFIDAQLPGASPETMASAVATPLEVQLSAIPGVAEMISSSSLGSTFITLQFAMSKDIDAAAQEVQAAINAAAGRLPPDMPRLPGWRKANPADVPVVILRVQSDVMPLTELSDFTETVLARRLSRIEGVAEVFIEGNRKTALRVQASPEKLAAYGLTLADIRGAVQAANVNQPKGALFGNQRNSTLQTNDQIFTPREYDAMVVAYRDGAPVFLKDVARVTFGPENEYVQAWQNGKPGLTLFVRRQSGANLIATADRIRALLPELRAQLPGGVQVEELIERTRTIRATLHEVEITLAVTAMLVILVMSAFLRQLAASAIVAAILAVSLIGTAGAMYLLGFSLNNLTLVALVIAVGFIVDDAIVVIENIHRHLEAGASMRVAALKGASEVSFTVLTISLSLIAAFIPLLFMGGVVGRIFREFAVTVAAAILVSVAASLTLGPMLASRFMKALSPARSSTHSFSAKLLAAYDRALSWSLAHPRAVLTVFGLTIAAAIASYVYVPKGFLPNQDTAYVLGSTEAVEDISYADMRAKHEALAQIIARDPAVLSYSHSVGTTQAISVGRFLIALKNRADRDVSADQFIERLRPQAAQIPGIQLSLRNVQDIQLGLGGSGAQYQYTLRSADSTLLAEWTGKLTARLKAMPELQDVSHDLQLGASVTRLTIDRVAAARFGLRVEDIDQALYDAFGQRQISEYQTEVNQYKIILEIDERQRGRAESLRYFHLRSPPTGQMVPLSAVARVEPPGTGPQVIAHDGMFPSANLTFNLAPGVALGDAVRLVLQAQAEIGLPSGVTGMFRGSAQAFQDSMATQPLLILTALLMVYVILGVLYESFVHPLTILSTLPSAGVGAIALLWAWGHDFSIMALIGIVLLIGIVKKNGILLVDFALERQRTHGLSAREAIHEACLARFRPITMTTLAAMLGATPLMMGLGTGSELRQPLGIAVFGGLLVSQLLTLFSTPVVFLALDRLFHRQLRGYAPQTVASQQVPSRAAGIL